MSEQITIYEVGPRDGLQNEATPVSTDAKISYIRTLAAAGLRKIEASSFVRPGVIPQLSDASEVFAGLRDVAGCDLIALVPNEKGMANAIEAGAREVAVFTAASDAFTQKNINCTIEESFERFAPVLKLASERGISVRGYVSTVVECPYAGRVEPNHVLTVTKRLLDAGCYQVSLGETIGVATPDDIARLLDVVCNTISPDLLAGHFHDTRGTALANVYRALEYGLRNFDASSAGLGGCPYAPGAAGNLATEDLLYALHRSGYVTGVDIHGVKAASDLILRAINSASASRVYRTL